jgi:hypothetical protein
MKLMLADLIKIQNEVKNIMDKKNKLKEDLNTKEIEASHKIDSIKNDITNLNSEIKNTEDKMLNNVKDHKKVNILQNIDLVFIEQ